MSKLWLAFVLLIIVSSNASSAESKPRPSHGKGGRVGVFPDEKMTVNGTTREYRLVVPKSIDASKPVPLLFAFHGFLIDSKDLMPAYSQLDQLAEKEGFVLVFPNAVDKAWRIVPILAKDDFAFFDKLLATICDQFNIDRNRICLTGMSNGALFSHLLAAHRSEVVAAIACHSGGLGILGRRFPSVKHKYGVMIIYGDQDSIANVEEGRKARDFYREREFPVEYLEVANLHHQWATKVDVNTKIWKFLMAHPLDAE